MQKRQGEGWGLARQRGERGGRSQERERERERERSAMISGIPVHYVPYIWNAECKQYKISVSKPQICTYKTQGNIIQNVNENILYSLGLFHRRRKRILRNPLHDQYYCAIYLEYQEIFLCRQYIVQSFNITPTRSITQRKPEYCVIILSVQGRLKICL